MAARGGWGTAIGVAIALLASARPGAGQAIGQEEALEIAREYLACDDDDQRGLLAAKLDAYQGDLEPIVRRLSERPYEPVEAGYHPAEHFADDELRAKHPDDLLYFTVPDDYDPERATGLIVFMHGGGRTTPRRAPRAFMNFPDENDEESHQLGDLFAATGMVAVGPSAPWNEDSSHRWCLRESDEYLTDVIRECENRFHIDPDRVFLIGHSMGGFGAYHHVQRQPDRFAAVIANSGSWSLACWPATRGTTLCIVHGVRDARRDVRWHYTDIEYARWTDKLLAGHGIDHVYLEHEGAHAVRFGRENIARFLDSSRELRRNPSAPHVTLVSPVGFRRSYCYPVEHNRWLTLNEAAEGEIEYDELVTRDDDNFDTWRLEHRRREREGASIDAIVGDGNAIVVTTRNVVRFTVWLYPRLVDMTRPVQVMVNERERFAGRVRPSLRTALESYERRRDWGLIYPAKIELAVSP